MSKRVQKAVQRMAFENASDEEETVVVKKPRQSRSKKTTTNTAETAAAIGKVRVTKKKSKQVQVLPGPGVAGPSKLPNIPEPSPPIPQRERDLAALEDNKQKAIQLFKLKKQQKSSGLKK